MSATWTPGDRFQLAARGDRYDGTTGRVRKVWTDTFGDHHAHVTHDDGTYTSWPTARLERPTDPSDGAVTSTPALSDDTSEIGDAIRELKHVVRTEDEIEGIALQVDDLWNRAQRHRRGPSLVDLDRQESADRALAALVEWRKAGDVKAHMQATIALRKAADEYIAAVTS